MSAYPKALIERIAAGIYESRSTIEPGYEPWTWPPKNPDDAQTMRDYAVGALDALGLRVELGEHFNPDALDEDPIRFETVRERRFVTDWETK